jgi:hypothetical protein
MGLRCLEQTRLSRRQSPSIKPGIKGLPILDQGSGAVTALCGCAAQSSPLPRAACPPLVPELGVESARSAGLCAGRGAGAGGCDRPLLPAQDRYRETRIAPSLAFLESIPRDSGCSESCLRGIHPERLGSLRVLLARDPSRETRIAPSLACAGSIPRDSDRSENCSRGIHLERLGSLRVLLARDPSRETRIAPSLARAGSIPRDSGRSESYLRGIHPERLGSLRVLLVRDPSRETRDAPSLARAGSISRDSGRSESYLRGIHP